MVIITCPHTLSKTKKQVRQIILKKYIKIELSFLAHPFLFIPFLPTSSRLFTVSLCVKRVSLTRFKLLRHKKDVNLHSCA